ncbi:ArgE/DapE family deacylase [Fructilactobacillus sanfranciscensis]|uniref:ArgE/DapE family deacylase n=1 Tax=Fructilactobacillus sanfranciscensis TaxID=1625 RepID=UPI0031F8AC04
MKKEEKIKILQDLVKINSVNGNEREISDYLSNLLNKYGIKHEIFPFVDDENRSNLIVEIGEGRTDQVFGLTGHQDTVAVTDESAWKYSAFSGTIEGDFLYGRGAADMKSGLAAEVIALIELVEKQQIPSGKVRLIITAGEEFGAPGAYKINPKLIEDLDALIVGEATNGNVKYAHSGSFNYLINSIGKSVHSSVPNQGINAIEGLVAYINDEGRVFSDLPVDEILGNVQHSITVIEGGKQINTIPGHAYLLGNVRPTPTFNNKQVRSLIEKTITKINQETDYQLKFELLHDFYPIRTLTNNSLVENAYQASKEFYPDRDIKLFTDNGATDASVFVQIKPDLPVIILGPDSNGSAHQINEHTSLSSYLATIDIYQKIINEFFAN